MSPKLALSAIGLYLLTGMLAASAAPAPAWFVARTVGATTVTLRGAAEFGRVSDVGAPGPYVLTLGAASTNGAIVFTWPDGKSPAPGVYTIGESVAGRVRALVVTGSATRPTGAYRARGGTLTITRASDETMQGRFELDAVGFEASAPMDEGRALIARGAFDARPTAQ
jgi:hypothetical protein